MTAFYRAACFGFAKMSNAHSACSTWMCVAHSGIGNKLVVPIRNIHLPARSRVLCALQDRHVCTQGNERLSQENDPHISRGKMLALGVIGVTGLGLFLKAHLDHVDAAVPPEAGKLKPGLPTYTIADLTKHKTKETRIWVRYKNGVYDITDYIAHHPGGSSKIILAAGGSLEPFWNLYAQHKTAEVFEIIEGFRIGNIVEEEKEEARNKDDPYANDPKRHVALKPSSSKPFNAEPPPAMLVENHITPNDLFFVRNHLPVPVVDKSNYRLEVLVEGTRKHVSLKLDDLKRKFPKKSVVSVVQCAGNRRSEMVKIKAVKGLNWGQAAISNAEWAGASLNDVLKHAGIDIDKVDCKHIQFEGLDKGPDGGIYGSSLPIDLARSVKDDIILAYEMNGVEIPRDHGYPIRVIIPGIVGARQVKWLSKIILCNSESDSHWQQKDYKGFNASVDWHNVDFTKAPAIMQLPVIAAICEPEEGLVLDEDADEVTVKGYAWSGGGRGIVRVDISADGGKTWHVADLEPNKQSMYKSWAWTLWEATVPLPQNHKGKVELICKAVDISYNVMPDRVEGIWNLRGVLSNAWHRVHVEVH